jgi:Protein of unknown function (DUF2635)
MRVKPAEGRAVLDPHTFRPLPAEGRNVPDSTFWRRRLRDKDVVLVEDAPEPQPLDAPDNQQPYSATGDVR